MTSTFREAHALTIEHWNNVHVDDPNGAFVESIGIDQDEFIQVMLDVNRAVIGMCVESGVVDAIKVFANVFLIGVMIGQKMEALETRTPGAPPEGS